MKEIKPWLLLAIIFYLLFLGWSFPAERALSFLYNRQVISPATISIADPSGSWSSGKAPYVRAGNIVIKNLSWSFQPASLLLGRLQFAVKGEIMANRISCRLSFDSNTFTVKNLNGTLPADTAIRPYLPGINLGGSLAADRVSLTIEKGFLQKASGQISWKEAALGSPYNTPLGGLSLALSTEENEITIKLNDLGGPLQADGLGFISPAGEYSYNGWVSASRESSPDLASFLQILGAPQADGKIKLDLKGKLPRLF
ncbi:MAG: type II secretion system protein N [Thermodesulfobacteriota bacterium]